MSTAPPTARGAAVRPRRRGDPRATSRSSRREVHGKPLVYLDNAATAQKPQAVIDAERDFYERATRTSTAACTGSRSTRPTPTTRAREKARAFLNAAAAHEIVFVRGTTEAINLVAQTYGRDARAGRATRS